MRIAMIGLVTIATLLGVPAYAKSPSVAIASPDAKAVTAMINAFYAGYRTGIGSALPDHDDRHDYTASLTALIKQWRESSTQDEVNQMNGFDWFCQCQDFDEKNARITISRLMGAGPGRIDANLIFRVFKSQSRKSRMRFVKEAKGWRMDDIVFEDDTTLRQGLNQDIRDFQLARVKAGH